MGAPLVSMVLLIQTGFICGTEKVTPIIGMKGGAVHLPATVPAEFSTRDVFWRHLSPTDHLVASFSRGSIDTNYQSRFYGRVRLLHNFTLVILNLELKDTGMFTCQMVDNNGHMRLHRFHLTVYVVAVPEVQVYTSRGTVDCSMILACNTSMGSNVTYSWVTDTGQGLPLNRTHTLHHDSRLLRVLLTPSDQNVSFTCIVTNMVSQEKTAVAPWTHCFGQQGSEAGVSSRKVFLLIGIFLAVTFILMLFLVFLLTRNSRKYDLRNRKETTDEETTLRHNGDTGRQEGESRLQISDERVLQRETSL
ncbi:SLAM family member 8-like isoform X2 [Hyla sarda]|uniref:SLAM family member 8-like isoform X2 n=1 Tax=Hyla sarda TaxID=327740 RepID=UPI0024C3670E|nr:SLAM family member 8-like isoform X2 [Hyla sarda]